MTVIKFADKPQQKIRPTKLPKCPLNQIVNDFFPLEFQSLFLTQVQLEEAAEIRIRLYRPLMILYRSCLGRRISARLYHHYWRSSRRTQRQSFIGRRQYPNDEKYFQLKFSYRSSSPWGG